MELFAAQLQAAFPRYRVAVFRPVLSAPYLMVSKGYFSAVLMRWEADGWKLKSGLPNGPAAVILGSFALLFGQRNRALLLKEVGDWMRAASQPLFPDY